MDGLSTSSQKIDDEKIILHQRKRNQKKSKKITTPQQISKRCCFGFPQAVLSSATKQNSNPKNASAAENVVSSTLFWLTCPKLSAIVSILENEESSDRNEQQEKPVKGKEKKMRRKFFFLSGENEETEMRRNSLMNVILKKSYLNFANFLFENHEDLFFGWKNSNSSEKDDFHIKWSEFVEKCENFFKNPKQNSDFQLFERILFEKGDPVTNDIFDDTESSFLLFREYMFQYFGMRKFGNGGVSKKIDEIKCLHSHVSSFLAGSDDLIGWLCCERIIEKSSNETKKQEKIQDLENVMSPKIEMSASDFKIFNFQDFAIDERSNLEDVVSDVSNLEKLMQSRKASVLEMIGSLFCFDSPFCEKYL